MEQFLHLIWAKGKIPRSKSTGCHRSNVLPKKRLGAVTHSVGCGIPAAA